MRTSAISSIHAQAFQTAFTRRQMLMTTGAGALGLGLLGLPALQAAETKIRKVLFFSKSAGFEHSVIKHTKEGELSHAEKVLKELGPKHGIDFTFSKDGQIFTKDSLEKFDAFFFYTTGDLTTTGGDHQPAMPPEGKTALLEAIHKGKGFIGSHCASDTFHTKETNGEKSEPGSPYKIYGDKAD